MTDGPEGAAEEEPPQLQSSLAQALERARTPSPYQLLPQVQAAASNPAIQRPQSRAETPTPAAAGDLRSSTPDLLRAGAQTPTGGRPSSALGGRVSSGRRVSSANSSYGLLVPRVSGGRSVDDLQDTTLAWEDTLTVAAMRCVCPSVTERHLW